MALRYQDVYPSPPLLDSAAVLRPSAADLLTLEYFEAEPDEMPEAVFAQHHLILNLRDEPTRVENRRDGVHRDFLLHRHEIVVTPAGLRSGWRWYERSKVIIITLEPKKLETFALGEVGVVLTGAQLQNLPQFEDRDLCEAGVMLRDALDGGVGSAVLFESLARVFLVRLIRKYAVSPPAEEHDYRSGFTARHHQKILEFVAGNYGGTISLEDLAAVAGISPSHFSKIFRSVIGQGPMQFVTSYRLEQAKKRLIRPDLPMVDIALGCGFADQAHFSRVFKQVEGITPRAYRAGLRD